MNKRIIVLSAAIAVSLPLSASADEFTDKINNDFYDGEQIVTNYTFANDTHQEQYKNYYFINDDDGNYGLYDADRNKIIIPLQDITIEGISDIGIIAKQRDLYAGLFDHDGNVIIPFMYDSLWWETKEVDGRYEPTEFLDYYQSYEYCLEHGSEEDYTGETGIYKYDRLIYTDPNGHAYFPKLITDGIATIRYFYLGDVKGSYDPELMYVYEIINYAGHNFTGERYKDVKYENGEFYTMKKYGEEYKLTEIPRDFAVVNVNGKYTDYDGVIRDDRTLVPMRDIIETLGGTVQWDDESRSVYCAIDDTEIHIEIDSDIMSVNGEETTIDVPAQIINDKTMLPLRAVAEAADFMVDWDGQLRAVFITK